MASSVMNPMTASGRQTFRSMFTTQKLVAGPFGEPMHVAEARMQTRQGLDTTTEDSLFSNLISAAREQVERDTMRAILWQRRSITLDEWPDRIDIYACPCRSIESIKYYDTAGTLQTLATTVYKTRLDLEPATITLKDTQVWPDVLNEAGSIIITFTAGYAVPFTVTTSTDLLTFSGFEPTTGDVYRLSNSGGSLPEGLSSTVAYYVIGASGSTCKLSLTSGGSAVDITTPGTGTHLLGQVPQSAMQAMRQLVARAYLAREGDVPMVCHESYAASLRSVKYTFG
jgi:uncharacterized phiE125 gp8 family phage protein